MMKTDDLYLYTRKNTQHLNSHVSNKGNLILSKIELSAITVAVGEHSEKTEQAQPYPDSLGKKAHPFTGKHNTKMEDGLSGQNSLRPTLV